MIRILVFVPPPGASFQFAPRMENQPVSVWLRYSSEHDKRISDWLRNTVKQCEDMLARYEAAESRVTQPDSPTAVVQTIIDNAVDALEQPKESSTIFPEEKTSKITPVGPRVKLTGPQVKPKTLEKGPIRCDWSMDGMRCTMLKGHKGSHQLGK